MRYTEEELASMSKEELIEKMKTVECLLQSYINKCDRLMEILSSIGIAYETYKREFKNE